MVDLSFLQIVAREAGTCRTCGAPITWATTGRNQRVPLDPPVEAAKSIPGAYRVELAPSGVGLRAVPGGTRRAHQETCSR